MAGPRKEQITSVFGALQYTVGTVESGAAFTTIQAAIDQAELDGANGDNPAEIIIFPAVYTENLTASNGGITLRSSVRDISAYIDGTITFTNPATGFCFWGLKGMAVTGLVTVTGANNDQGITVGVENSTLNGGYTMAAATSTVISSLQCFDSLFLLPAGNAIIMPSSGNTNLEITSTRVLSNETATCLSYGGPANFRQVEFRGQVTQGGASSSIQRYHDCYFETESQDCLVLENSVTVEVTGSTFELDSTAGYAINKSGAGRLDHSGNTFYGNFIDPPINIAAGSELEGSPLETKIGPYKFPTTPTVAFNMPSVDGEDGYVLTTDGSGNFSFEPNDSGGFSGLKYTVGNSVSGANYQTIQEAIDAAEADGANGNAPAEIVITPGYYTENLTSSCGGITLRGTSQNTSPFIIGDVTFTNDSTGDNLWVLKDVYLVGGSLTVTGASTGFCFVEINGTNIQSGFDFSGSSGTSNGLNIRDSVIRNTGGDVIQPPSASTSIIAVNSRLEGDDTGTVFDIDGNVILINCRTIGQLIKGATDKLSLLNTSFATNGQVCITDASASSTAEIKNCSFEREGAAGPIIEKTGAAALELSGGGVSGAGLSDPLINVTAGTYRPGNIVATRVGPYDFPENPTNIFTMPSIDGEDGYVLTTDGAGSLSFEEKLGGLKYTVGLPVTGANYQTVQDAVDAAEADGADASNPAEIIIFPGIYSETVTITGTGIALRGISQLSSVSISAVNIVLNSTDGMYHTIAGLSTTVTITGSTSGFAFIELINSNFIIDTSGATFSGGSGCQISNCFISSANLTNIDTTIASSFLQNSTSSTNLTVDTAEISNSYINGKVQKTANGNLAIANCYFTSTAQEGLEILSTSGTQIVHGCTFFRAGTAGPAIIYNGPGSNLRHVGNTFSGNVTDPPLQVTAGTSNPGNVIEPFIGPYQFPTSPTNVFQMPGSDGSANDVLTTDGVGGLSFQTIDHGNIDGLGDDDHTQYLLVSGTRAMSGNLDMGSNNIVSVGTVDGVDVSAHAARHNPGGADALATASAVGLTAASTNTEGNATSFARSNHTHSINVTTGTLSTINAGDIAQNGTATGLARRDHQHPVATASASTLSGSNTEGVSTSLARADHNHALGGTVGGDLSGTLPNPTVVDLTISGEAQGDILYRNASNWVRLAAGTSGEALLTQGVGSNPIWGAPAPAGHAASHISGGSDEINGDQLDIDWNPSNYTPTTSPTEVTSLDHLTAHLAGIDAELAALSAPSALEDVLIVGNTTGENNISVNDGYAIEFGTTPATTGVIRLSNTDTIYARDAGDTADIGLIGSNASDDVVVGSGGTDRLTITDTETTFLYGSTGLQLRALVSSPGSFAIYSDDITPSAVNYSLRFDSGSNTFVNGTTSARLGVSNVTKVRALTSQTEITPASTIRATFADTLTTLDTDLLVDGHYIEIDNSTAPAAPSTGGRLYVEGGALKYISSSGTVTTIAPV